MAKKLDTKKEKAISKSTKTEKASIPAKKQPGRGSKKK